MLVEQPQQRPQVGWRLWDIIAVLVLPLLVGIGGLIGILAGLALSGVQNMQGRLEAEPVLFGMGLGLLIYALFFVAVALLIRFRKLRWSDLGVKQPPMLAMALTPVIALGQLIAIAITNLALLQLTGQFENPQVEAITGGQGFSWQNFSLALLVVGLWAPFVEELLFRGLIFGWLRARMPIGAAIVVSAAIFAAAHVIPQLFPALFVVGLILAAAYHWSGSLWVSTTLHAMQNSLVVTLLFVSLAFPQPA